MSTPRLRYAFAITKGAQTLGSVAPDGESGLTARTLTSRQKATPGKPRYISMLHGA